MDLILAGCWSRQRVESADAHVFCRRVCPKLADAKCSCPGLLQVGSKKFEVV